MKICKRCKKKKPISAFYKHKKMADGHLSFCKDCKRIDGSNYYANNKDKVKEYQAKPDVKIRKAKIKKQWNINNKKHTQAYSRDNKAHRNQQRREKYSNDPEYRILVLLRGRMYAALNGIYRSAKTVELLGCSIKELRIYIESLFQQGMNWNNQGKWEIDHIKPCASFNLINPGEQKECFNYINLQPLWAEDNLKKSKLELF